MNNSIIYAGYRYPANH